MWSSAAGVFSIRIGALGFRDRGMVFKPDDRHYDEDESRTADLDILYYGDRIILNELLTVPHPRLHRRRFALLPMCEVAPDMVHPVLGLTQRDLLARCPDTLLVKKMKFD